jgi:hypothetical protein
METNPNIEAKIVICNKCGSSCQIEVASGIYCTEGLIEVEVHAGYAASIMDDGDVHRFSLCEKCLVELIETFKHPSLQGNRIDYVDWDIDGKKLV